MKYIAELNDPSYTNLLLQFSELDKEWIVEFKSDSECNIPHDISDRSLKCIISIRDVKKACFFNSCIYYLTRSRDNAEWRE